MGGARNVALSVMEDGGAHNTAYRLMANNPANKNTGEMGFFGYVSTLFDSETMGYERN